MLLSKNRHQKVACANSKVGSNTKISRVRPILLLVLIFVSTITTIPFLQNTNALAITDEGGPSAIDSTSILATKSATNDSTYLDWLIKTYVYYTTLDVCIGNTSNWGSSEILDDKDTSKYSEYVQSQEVAAGGATSTIVISSSNANKGNWFNAITQGHIDVKTGVYMRDATNGIGSGGTVNCIDNGGGKDTSNPTSNPLIQNALKTWGISAAEILCNSGWRTFAYDHQSQTPHTQTPDQCIQNSKASGNPGFYKYTTNAPLLFEKYVSGRLYGNSTEINVSSLKNDATGYYDVAAPDTKGAALYIFYRHSLNESCIRGIDTTPPRPADTAYSTNDTTTVYTDVSWVDNAGTLSKGIYIATQKDFKDSTKWYSDAKVNLGPIGPSYSPTVYSSTQCSEIVKQMNFWAPKYADWLVTGTSNKPQSAGPTANPQDQNASTATSCAIDGIGWLVCPVMTFMGKVVDATYGLVSALLAVPPLNTNPTNTDPSNSIYSAWSAMRTIANVAFVIAFLIIIFSQLTGVGIDNYGIKKLLPRIIIAAILVNLSYFICAIAVDLSNILGSSLKSFFDGIQANIVSAPSFGSTGLTGWAGLTQGVITGGAVVALVGVFGGFSLLFPALIAAVLTIVVVFLILTIRQALIIILIVISPIAFVAFLLPNTMNLFKQWQKLLTTLLLMFPIIAAIFGGSALASVVIMNSSSSFPVQIMGALVAIVPLALTPIIMKSSGSLLGSIGSKIQGYSKKPSEALNKAAAGVRSREQAAKNTAAMNRTFSARGALLRRSARLGAIGKARDDELARQKSNYVVAETGNKDSSLLRSMTRGSSKEARELAQSRAMAAAVSAADKAEDEQVSNAATLIRSQTTAVNRIDSTKAMFDAAAKSGDKIKARAAMSVLLSSGAPGIKAVHEVVSTINEPALSDNSEQAKRVNSTISSLRSDINSAGLKGKDNVLSAYGYSAEEVKNPVTGAMEKTGRGLSINEIANSVKTYSKLNATELAGQDEDVLKGAKDLKDANGVRAITGAQARDALTNPNARQNLNAIKISYLEEISRADP